jgi:hypothetical protein
MSIATRVKLEEKILASAANKKEVFQRPNLTPERHFFLANQIAPFVKKILKDQTQEKIYQQQQGLATPFVCLDFFWFCAVSKLPTCRIMLKVKLRHV